MGRVLAVIIFTVKDLHDNSSQNELTQQIRNFCIKLLQQHSPTPQVSPSESGPPLPPFTQPITQLPHGAPLSLGLKESPVGPQRCGWGGGGRGAVISGLWHPQVRSADPREAALKWGVWGPA